MESNIKIQQTKADILTYLKRLDADKYMNISNMLANQTSTNRLIDDIFDRMLVDQKIPLPDLVNEVEISLM